MPEEEIEPPAKKRPAKKKSVSHSEAGSSTSEPKLSKTEKPVQKTVNKAPKATKPKDAETQTGFQIYNAPGLQSHPSRPPRDLVKVFIRNPLEAYVYWEIAEASFQIVLDDFGNPEKHEIQLKLKLAYLTPNGKEKEEWYDVHPLSNSYYCKLHSPAKSVRAEVYASYKGKVRLFLETKGGDLPTGLETRELDPEWIHPEWVRMGLVKQVKDGGYVLTDEFFTWREAELGENPSFQPFGSSHPTSPGSSWGKR